MVWNITSTPVVASPSLMILKETLCSYHRTSAHLALNALPGNWSPEAGVTPLTTQNVQNGESHMFTPSLTHWARPQQESFPLLQITQPIVRDSFWDVISRPSILISWTACIMEALMHGGETIQSLSPSFHYGESCLRQHCHCLMSHPSHAPVSRVFLPDLVFAPTQENHHLSITR